MREIKFRVWGKFPDENEGTLFGYERLSVSGNWEYKRLHRPDWSIGTITDNQGNATFKRDEFINRNDMNDIETYTGDIIERWQEGFDKSLRKIRGVVFYDSTKLEYRMRNVVRAEDVIGFSLNESWIGHDYQIVGNIYDNPELLTKTEVK